MQTERYFYDAEEDKVYTLAELSRIYVDIQQDGNTEAESFADWLRNVTDKNGSLDEITNNDLQGWLTYHSLHSSDADLPVIPMDWTTESPISTWGINGMQDFIVVREWNDYIYDVYDNPVAVGVFVMKPKPIRR